MREAEQAVNKSKFFFADAQLADDERAQGLRGLCLHLQTNDAAATTTLQRAFKIAHKVFGFFFNFDIAVTQQAKRALPYDVVAREETTKEKTDHIFERDEMDNFAVVAVRQTHEALDLRRDRQQRIHRLAIGLTTQLQRQRETEIGDERERMGRINGERREDREDLFEETRFEPRKFFGRHLLGGEHGDARAAQFRADRKPEALLLLHERVGAGIDTVELLRRCEAVLAQRLDTGANLTAQARHADHVKFVEVRG